VKVSAASAKKQLQTRETTGCGSNITTLITKLNVWAHIPANQNNNSHNANTAHRGLFVIASKKLAMTKPTAVNLRSNHAPHA
jgi:hypothetical protein